MQPVLDAAEIWAASTGNWVRLVSANDHDHARNSMHYKDAALDFHSNDLDGLTEWMRRLGFNVLWRVPGHYGHAHVEYKDG
jgi:hypothetical protein